MNLHVWFICGLLGTALVAGLGPACAEESDASQAANKSTAPPRKADTNSEPANTEEVIVTAQRREERLRDVPMTVSVLSAEDLALTGAVNTSDLQRITPGVRMQFNGAYLAPSIRGVSSNTTAPGLRVTRNTSASGLA